MPANEPVDLQPSDLEAMQAESTPEPPIHVQVAGIDGPVRTQALPRKSGGTRTRAAVGTTPVRILSADHRRASAKVVSIGQAMLFALTAAAKEDPSTMALWPASVPYELTADTELWVASATGTTSITVVTEFWATGE
jgi:hypothetical protein